MTEEQWLQDLERRLETLYAKLKTAGAPASITHRIKDTQGAFKWLNQNTRR